MIIDGKGKLFGKVSIIDILIVLVIILAIWGVRYKFSKSNGGIGEVITGSSGNKVIMTFYGEEAPEFALKNVNQGDLVRELDRNIDLGNVTSIKIEKGVAYVQTEHGYIKSSREGYSSYYLTVEGTGIVDDLGLSIKGVDYQIGRALTIKVGKSIFQGRLYNLETKE